MLLYTPRENVNNGRYIDCLINKKYVGADLGVKHWNEPPGGAL
jgi:hypothetical protein